MDFQGLVAEKTVINGTGYAVTKMPYKIGHRVLLRLYKVGGPTVAAALSDMPTGMKVKDLRNIDIAKLAPMAAGAIEALAARLTEEDFDFIVDAMAEFSQVSPGQDRWVPLKTDMELRYAGNYSEMFQWFAFALRVNFGGFFTGPGSLASLLARLKAVSPSQDTSTGPSTGSPAPAGTTSA